MGRVLLGVVCTVVLVGCGSAHEARVVLLVSNGAAEAYANAATRESVAAAVMARLNLEAMPTVSARADRATQTVTVTVEAEQRQQAVDVANAIADQLVRLPPDPWKPAGAVVVIESPSP